MNNGHESLSDYQEILQDGFDHLQEISSGGGGIIIKAHHKGLDKDVIIKKVIRSKVSALGKTGERDVLKNLKHPYLPQIYDYIERGDDVFTVMEFIPGQSFSEILQEGKRKFTKRELVKWTTQLCEVVAYLHAQKPAIIHCDIKPGNIMLTPDDNICLIDFNISGVQTPEGPSAVGYTPGYAPAEQYLVVMERKAKLLAQQVQAAEDNVSQTAERNPLVASGKSSVGRTPAESDETEVDENATRIDENAAPQIGDATEIDENATQIDPSGGSEKNGQNGAANAATGRGPFRADENATEIGKGEVPQDQKKQTVGGNVNADSIKSSDEILEMLRRGGIKPEIDGRTDIYSVGATMYHIATGVKPAPFYEKNKPITQWKSDLPDGLVFLITKAMMLQPQDRFKTGEEMLKVARNINKLDSRYKRVNRLETILVLLFGALTIGCVLLATRGWRLIGEEKHNRYDSLVMQMEELRVGGEYGQILQCYEDALLIFPEESPAYVQMALYYYQSKDYEKCLDYLYNTVFVKDGLTHSEQTDQFYFLAGSCYFMLEDYEEAALNYEKAIACRSDVQAYYRDYVIALARVGKTQQARETLERAKTIGIVEDILLLLEGEISYMEGRMDAAQESLQQCISLTKDPEILARAYGKLDEVYRDGSREDSRYLKRIELLEQAKNTLQDEYRITLMERLAQVYIDYADISGENEYNEKAIRLFLEIREMGLGYGTFQTDYNIAILYEKQGDYDNAAAWLGQMLRERGEDYRWYKRLSFVELARQMEFENQERDYLTFEEYYLKAKKLYEDLGGKNTDVEMQILEERYKDLIDLGWLER